MNLKNNYNYNATMQIRSCCFKDFEDDEFTGNGASVCDQVFMQFPTTKSHQQELETFLHACRQKATTRQDTCKYTSLYVHSLRQSGLTSAGDSACRKSWM